MSEPLQVKESPQTKTDRPKIVATWNGSNWIIDVKDEDGKNEVSPRLRNLLMKSMSCVLRQRYRMFRVRGRMAQGELSPQVK